MSTRWRTFCVLPWNEVKMNTSARSDCRALARSTPAWKRILDISVSAAGLLVLSPLLGLVAAAIRLEDGGPVIYRQVRVGSGGAELEIAKFRSMRVSQEPKMR